MHHINTSQACGLAFFVCLVRFKRCNFSLALRFLSRRHLNGMIKLVSEELIVFWLSKGDNVKRRVD